MKTLMAIGFIIIGSMQGWAADSDLFPLEELKLGMMSADLLRVYPNMKTAYSKKNTAGELTEGLVLCDIPNGVYWDGALIQVNDSEVQSWSYVQTKDFDRAAKNVGRIRKSLAQTLGETLEKKVAYHYIRQGKVRSPVFIWKRGDAMAVFTHSPVKKHGPGEPFVCQLTISPNAETLQSLFDLVKDTKDSDAELFEDVTNGSPKADR